MSDGNLVMTGKSALIIGASRGLGFGVVEQLVDRDWSVVATHRGETGSQLVDLAEHVGQQLHLESVDINETDQVTALHQRLAGSQFDLVLVNAGITHERWETVAEVSTSTFEHLMVTNALSPMRLIERFQDVTSPVGTLAVMSSSLGSIANNTQVRGWEVYRASKSALNQLMRSFAARHPDDPRTLLLLVPGWVRTDMGGPEASLSVQESTKGLADVIEARAGRGGLHFVDYRDGVVPW